MRDERALLVVFSLHDCDSGCSLSNDPALFNKRRTPAVCQFDCSQQKRLFCLSSDSRGHCKTAASLSKWKSMNAAILCNGT